MLFVTAKGRRVVWKNWKQMAKLVPCVVSGYICRIKNNAGFQRMKIKDGKHDAPSQILLVLRMGVN